MSKTIVILMGLQGSGKSTFYSRHLADDFVRINLDTSKWRDVGNSGVRVLKDN